MADLSCRTPPRLGFKDDRCQCCVRAAPFMQCCLHHAKMNLLMLDLHESLRGKDSCSNTNPVRTLAEPLLNKPFT